MNTIYWESKFTPHMQSLLERLERTPFKGDSMHDGEDQAGIVRIALFDPNHKHHQRLWDQQNIHTWEWVRDQGMIDQMRHCIYRGNPLENCFTKSSDAMLLVHNFLPRAALDAKKESADYKSRLSHEYDAVKKLDQQLAEIQREEERADRMRRREEMRRQRRIRNQAIRNPIQGDFKQPVPTGWTHKHVKPTMGIKPIKKSQLIQMSSTQHDCAIKAVEDFQEPTAQRKERLLKMRQKRMDKISFFEELLADEQRKVGYTSNEATEGFAYPLKEVEDIPSGYQSGASVERNGTTLSINYGRESFHLLDNEITREVAKAVDELIAQKPKYEAEYRWFAEYYMGNLDDLFGTYNVHQDKWMPRKLERDEMATELGISFHQLVARKREFFHFLEVRLLPLWKESDGRQSNTQRKFRQRLRELQD